MVAVLCVLVDLCVLQIKAVYTIMRLRLKLRTRQNPEPEAGFKATNTTIKTPKKIPLPKEGGGNFFEAFQ